jgi:thioredoxin-like negative regulator of GroEL
VPIVYLVKNGNLLDQFGGVPNDDGSKIKNFIAKGLAPAEEEAKDEQSQTGDSAENQNSQPESSDAGKDEKSSQSEDKQANSQND